MNRSLRYRATVARAFRGVPPVKLVFLGYFTCIVVGWILLSLPVAHQVTGTSALDHLFIATSAVSTTGLATVSPAGSYTLFGELVILLLIQIGGIGYMTMGSFIVLTRGRKLTQSRERMLSSDFAMPKSFALDEFVRGVIVFTVVAEVIGAALLWALFSSAGVENAGYQAIFHSISAFCTAGFSLFDTSLESFAGNVGVNAVISVLALLGAIGFIVAVDGWRVVTGRQKHLTFTSRIILRLTMLLMVAGVGLLFLTEQQALNAAPAQHLLESFFQAMTAMTTVGFNTAPIGAFSQGAMVVMLLLMLVGASPSGTGGGMKTTTLSAVYAVMRSVLRGQTTVTFWRRRVPADRITAATASFAFYVTVLATGIFLLALTEAQTFDLLVFEATSALGTVGLSMGATGDLSPLGKLVIVLLMFAGRLGPLSFGSALFLRDDDSAEVGTEADVVL